MGRHRLVNVRFGAFCGLKSDISDNSEKCHVCGGLRVSMIGADCFVPFARTVHPRLVQVAASGLKPRTCFFAINSAPRRRRPTCPRPVAYSGLAARSFAQELMSAVF